MRYADGRTRPDSLLRVDTRRRSPRNACLSPPMGTSRCDGIACWEISLGGYHALRPLSPTWRETPGPWRVDYVIGPYWAASPPLSMTPACPLASNRTPVLRSRLPCISLERDTEMTWTRLSVEDCADKLTCPSVWVDSEQAPGDAIVVGRVLDPSPVPLGEGEVAVTLRTQTLRDAIEGDASP